MLGPIYARRKNQCRQLEAHVAFAQKRKGPLEIGEEREMSWEGFTVTKRE